MLRSSVFGACLSILAILLGGELRLASGQVPDVQPVDSRPVQRAQFRVVDSPFSAKSHGTRYFTIAGAVKRSGVFSAELAQVPLTTLLQAAGGVATEGAVTIRIYSSQVRPRAQLYFNGQSTETVRPGELVVVFQSPSQATSEAVEVVPVICVGLQERPVVLPLHPNVANVPTLVQQLMQPREVAESIQRFDPAGRSSSPDLAGGSILVFDPARLNPVGLQSAQEFPPAVSLDEALNPPVEANNPPESETVKPAAPTAEMPTSLFEAPMPTQALEQRQPIGAPPMVVRDFRPADNAAIVLAPPQGLRAPSPMPAPEPKVVILPESSFAATDVTGFPSLPAPEEALGLPSELHTRMAVIPASSSSTQVVSGAAALSPEPTPAPPIQPDVVHAKAVPAVVAEGERSQSSPSPIVTMPSKDEIAAPAANSDVVETVASKAGSRGGLVSIALGVAVLMVLCLGVCIVWSHYDNLAFQKEYSACGAPLPAKTEAEAPIASAPRSRLDDVIDQRMPVVEESPNVAMNVEIHGRAVGHRRLALHDAHPALAGPHFAMEPRGGERPSQVTNAQSERQLRGRLRAALQTAAQPVSSPAYDVVQVETARPQQGVARDPAEGSLDRALRSISREKQS